MSRSKSVLNMMMMSYIALGIVGIVYVLWGWSMSFAGEDGGSVFANPFDLFGLKDVPLAVLLRGVMFQLTFAMITAALISGCDRRPGASLGLDAVRPALGDAVLLPARPLGLRTHR